MFAVGFNIFLAPSELNAGGISGLAMVVDQVLKTGSVGIVAAVMNVPLFAIAGLKIGKKFFWGSFVGMAFLSLFIDLFASAGAGPASGGSVWWCNLRLWSGTGIRCGYVHRRLGYHCPADEEKMALSAHWFFHHCF